LNYYVEQKWGFLPQGGTGALVRALVQLFTELGGDIRFERTIERIVTRKGKVTGIQRESGQREAFGDCREQCRYWAHHNSLLSHDVLARRPERDSENVAQHVGCPHFISDTEKISKFGQHNVIFGLRYKELLEIFLIEVSWQTIFRSTFTAPP